MMRKNRFLKEVMIIAILVKLLCMPIVNLAHSGRTDSSGGHRDNKNASGLGSYHYHCGGHPAHLHTGGVCPYSSSAVPATTVTTSSSTSSSSTSSKTTTTPKKVTATKVEIDVEDVEILIGESKKIIATVSPSNAEDKSVTWKSSNKEVAMVDSEGEILALGVGEATITVTTSNGKESSVNVSVKPIKVTEITLNETEVKLKVDESFTLTATVLPENATDKSIEWSSENSEIATVENGQIKAIAAGTTKIICLSKDEIKSEVNVVVEKIVEEENTVEVVAPVDNNPYNSNSSDGDAVAGLITMGVLVGGPVYAYKKIRNRK